jgi:hypothetical protein
VNTEVQSRDAIEMTVDRQHVRVGPGVGVSKGCLFGARVLGGGAIRQRPMFAPVPLSMLTRRGQQ